MTWETAEAEKCKKVVKMQRNHSYPMADPRYGKPLSRVLSGLWKQIESWKAPKAWFSWRTLLIVLLSSSCGHYWSLFLMKRKHTGLQGGQRQGEAVGRRSCHLSWTSFLPDIHVIWLNFLLCFSLAAIYIWSHSNLYWKFWQLSPLRPMSYHLPSLLYCLCDWRILIVPQPPQFHPKPYT